MYPIHYLGIDIRNTYIRHDLKLTTKLIIQSVISFTKIVNWADPSWWQARKVNSTERPGLIPSQDLEERRQCFVRNGFNKQVSCCGQRVMNC